jgi:NTE family protein
MPPLVLLGREFRSRGSCGALDDDIQSTRLYGSGRRHLRCDRQWRDAAIAGKRRLCYDADALAADISAKLFAQDELARPIPETPTVSDLAKGLDRTLVLGGGGEYYVAWYCGFFHGLYELGVDLNIAEMVVGTSAGAYAGSSLTSGHFQRLRSEFDFFGHFPSLFARLAPVASPNLSQRRAQEINFSVKDGSPASIRAIGHAALAADNRVNGSAVERLAALLTLQHDRLASGKDVYHR